VIFAALSLTGLQFLSDALNQAVLFLPSLLAAGALLLAGVVLGGFAREWVDRLAYQMDLPLGRIAQVVVVVVVGYSPSRPPLRWRCRPRS
jgi:uncharacterized membrane protein YraQ (UPF0718 family)